MFWHVEPATAFSIRELGRVLQEFSPEPFEEFSQWQGDKKGWSAKCGTWVDEDSGQIYTQCL